MTTEPSGAAAGYRLPGFADIVHLRGCPASDQQPSYPMPPLVEAYRLDPPRLDDAGVKAPPVNVSHCCKCGGMGYQWDGDK